jgi:hypothetical protein
MKLRYGKYEFTCKFEKQAVLPDFKGSTFHHKTIFTDTDQKICADGCQIKPGIFCDDQTGVSFHGV